MFLVSKSYKWTFKIRKSTTVCTSTSSGWLKNACERMVSTSEIFSILSDSNTLTLFNAISSKSVQELIPKLNITDKQYNVIISSLEDVSLVRKKDDAVFLTSLGKVFYYFYTKLSIAMDNCWKLKCIDILEESDYVPTTEVNHIINIIITDNLIQEILKGKLMYD